MKKIIITDGAILDEFEARARSLSSACRAMKESRHPRQDYASNIIQASAAFKQLVEDKVPSTSSATRRPVLELAGRVDMQVYLSLTGIMEGDDLAATKWVAAVEGSVGAFINAVELLRQELALAAAEAAEEPEAGTLIASLDLDLSRDGRDGITITVPGLGTFKLVAQENGEALSLDLYKLEAQKS